MYFAIIASDKPFGVYVRDTQEPNDPVFEIPEVEFTEEQMREKATARVQAVINGVQVDRRMPEDVIFMIGSSGDSVTAKFRAT